MQEQAKEESVFFMQGEILGTRTWENYLYVFLSKRIIVYQHFQREKKPELVEEIHLQRECSLFDLNADYFAVGYVDGSIEIRKRGFWELLVYATHIQETLTDIIISGMTLFLEYGPPIQHQLLIFSQPPSFRSWVHASNKRKTLYFSQLANIPDFFLALTNENQIKFGMLYTDSEHFVKEFEFGTVDTGNKNEIVDMSLELINGVWKLIQVLEKDNQLIVRTRKFYEVSHDSKSEEQKEGEDKKFKLFQSMFFQMQEIQMNMNSLQNSPFPYQAGSSELPQFPANQIEKNTEQPLQFHTKQKKFIQLFVKNNKIYLQTQTKIFIIEEENEELNSTIIPKKKHEHLIDSFCDLLLLKGACILVQEAKPKVQRKQSRKIMNQVEKQEEKVDDIEEKQICSNQQQKQIDSVNHEEQTQIKAEVNLLEDEVKNQSEKNEEQKLQKKEAEQEEQQYRQLVEQTLKQQIPEKEKQTSQENEQQPFQSKQKMQIEKHTPLREECIMEQSREEQTKQYGCQTQSIQFPKQETKSKFQFYSEAVVFHHSPEDDGNQFFSNYEDHLVSLEDSIVSSSQNLQKVIFHTLKNCINEQYEITKNNTLKKLTNFVQETVRKEVVGAVDKQIQEIMLKKMDEVTNYVNNLVGQNHIAIHEGIKSVIHSEEVKKNKIIQAQFNEIEELKTSMQMMIEVCQKRELQKIALFEKVKEGFTKLTQRVVEMEQKIEQLVQKQENREVKWLDEIQTIKNIISKKKLMKNSQRIEESEEQSEQSQSEQEPNYYQPQHHPQMFYPPPPPPQYGSSYYGQYPMYPPPPPPFMVPRKKIKSRTKK